MRDERKTIEAEADGLIEGRNAVIEALRAGTAIDKVYIARGETDATLGHIAASARDRGVVVVECDRRKLDGMSLNKEGLWVFGTAADGNTSLYDADLKGPAVIVIGSEGDGMGRLVREQCDFLVSIPMRGRLNSLNASAAAAVVLYEAVRQRG